MVQIFHSPAVLTSSKVLVITFPEALWLHHVRGPDGCWPIIQTMCFLSLACFSILWVFLISQSFMSFPSPKVKSVRAPILLDLLG